MNTYLQAYKMSFQSKQSNAYDQFYKKQKEQCRKEYLKRVSGHLMGTEKIIFEASYGVDSILDVRFRSTKPYCHCTNEKSKIFTLLYYIYSIVGDSELKTCTKCNVETRYSLEMLCSRIKVLTKLSPGILHIKSKEVSDDKDDPITPLDLIEAIQNYLTVKSKILDIPRYEKLQDVWKSDYLKTIVKYSNEQEACSIILTSFRNGSSDTIIKVPMEIWKYIFTFM